MIGTGLVLDRSPDLELSAREHFAGYRSHTLLLAGAVGMLVFGGLFVGVSALHPAIRAAAGALAFGGPPAFFSRLRSAAALAVPSTRSGPSQLRLQRPDENPLLPRPGAEPFRLAESGAREQLARAGPSPAALAAEQLAEAHALSP